jgi:hypothetical protein
VLVWVEEGGLIGDRLHVEDNEVGPVALTDFASILHAHGDDAPISNPEIRTEPRIAGSVEDSASSDEEVERTGFLTCRDLCAHHERDYGKESGEEGGRPLGYST